MTELFKSISFEEAYRTIIEQDKQLRMYRAEQAILNGPRDIDKDYTDLTRKSRKYQSQFSEDELMELMNKALKEGKLFA